MREKTFANFAVLWLYVKVFYAKVFCVKFGAWHSWRGKSEQSPKVFSMKIIFSPIHESFLPRKFPTIQYVSEVHLGSSLVPRPCAFVTCSMEFCANFLLQATNAQGLGTRLYLDGRR